MNYADTSLIYKRSDKVLLLIIILLFSIDLVTYLPFGSVTLIKSIDLLCVLCLSFYFFKISPSKSFFNRDKILIAIYLFLLLIRLYNDFVLDGIVFFMYKDPITIFVFVLMTMLIPYKIGFDCEFAIDTKKLFYILGIILTLCLGISARDILLGNLIALNGGRFNASENIDTIYYGHLGVSLILIGVFLLTKIERIIHVLPIIFLIIGALSTSFAGSRGPIMALLICLVFIMLCKMNARKIIVFVVLGAFFYGYLPDLILAIDNLFQSYDIRSFHRIAESFIYSDEIYSSGRDSIFMHGWNLFLEHPLVGYRYLLPDDSYVHNIFIEQFMALGVIGGGIFVAFNISVIKKGYHLAKYNPEYILIPTLFIQYMIFGCFSRTIIAIPQYWLFLFLTLGLYESNKK